MSRKSLESQLLSDPEALMGTKAPPGVTWARHEMAERFGHWAVLIGCLLVPRGRWGSRWQRSCCSGPSRLEGKEMGMETEFWAQKSGSTWQ